MIALQEAARAGLLKPAHWANNIVAGLVVGVVALPLSMAFAIASGARPEQGIYTAIVAGIMVSLFGGSRLQIAGPTGAFIAILAGITATYGIDGLQVATLMAGVMLLLMGLFRLGGIVQFIPAPVIIGFTAGIGVIIFTGQWADFLGVERQLSGQFHQKLWAVIKLVPYLSWPTLTIGVVSLAILLINPRIKRLRRIPGPLIVLVAATLIQSIFRFDGVATIGSAFGGIPTGLPAFELPQLSFGKMLLLVGPAMTIAMLGAIESLLSAVVAVNVGVVLAVLHFLRRMTQTVKIQQVEDTAHYRLSKAVGPLFFGAVGPIELAARSVPDSVSRWIIDLSETPFIDATAIEALEDAITNLKARGIAVTLAGANSLVFRKLSTHGTVAMLGEGGYVSSVQHATNAVD